MKSLIVRLAVLSLAVTGFAASTVVSKAAPNKKVVAPVVIGTWGPSPMCTPGTGNYCGLH